MKENLYNTYKKKD